MESKAISVEAQWIILQAFSRTLNRESHVLTQRPDLLWQQLYNRLQWEEQPTRLLESELERRNASHSSPWIKLKTPLRESRSLVRTFAGHLKYVRSVAPSPDGSYVASISGDYNLSLWEIATGQIVWTLNLEGGYMFSITFSPGGEQLFCAIVTDDHKAKLKVVEANTGTFLYYLSIELYVWRVFVLSSDWRVLITPGMDIKLHQWQISIDQELSPKNPDKSYITALAFSPDERTIVYASSDNVLRVWDTATGQLRTTLEGHREKVVACAFSPDGQFIASTSEDNTLRVWDARTGREVWLQGGIMNPRWCTFSPDGCYVGTAYWGNTLRIWDTLTGEPVCTFEGHTNSVGAGVFLPDGRFIVSASGDNTLRLWEITTSIEQPKDVGAFRPPPG